MAQSIQHVGRAHDVIRPIPGRPLQEEDDFETLRDIAERGTQYWKKPIRGDSEREVESQPAYECVGMLAKGTGVENALHIGLQVEVII